MVEQHNRRKQDLWRKAERIELLLADCDGVLTDGSVYYSARGEELKRFSMRDGMGVQRLREIGRVEVGIVSGEDSEPLRRRAEKLNITELHLAVLDKSAVLKAIRERRHLEVDQVGFIGDDVNDLDLIEHVGLFACPGDAMPQIKKAADYICTQHGGRGALREVADLLIAARVAASLAEESVQPKKG